MHNPRYRNGFTPTRHDDVLQKPLQWTQPRKIFVNSMSDTFHEDIPDEFIERMFDVMGKADWHVFQILTKRTERMVQLPPRLSWKPPMWQGVTVEDAALLQ
jgi:protein gp37